ncbi:hypothetical protein [Nostoc sphaeroides]|uniref:Uncharacterized protein n=1 Tax=Nostoc sphaeroides CCNUC1 TaxID=2653204 RepID=A0A5P8VSE7_9NOSO|nr:hypothetical protein [Nostoc sphaeroides]QFS42839.1 hypothetical protein GXM_00312 [Nostoc sphaeroides CCNUC1]
MKSIRNTSTYLGLPRLTSASLGTSRSAQVRNGQLTLKANAPLRREQFAIKLSLTQRAEGFNLPREYKDFFA